MRTYNLIIAGYYIRFEADASGPDLVPSARFLRNLVNENNPDVLIRVHSGKYFLPPGADKVFNAPYVEEINGIRIKNKDEFWSVYKNQNYLYITTIFPLSSEKKKAMLKFSFTAKEWELWFENADNETDPMEYPLDGLILYYLTAIHGDIMIHASGINVSGRGYIFSGISGKGKTTMTKLWDNYGARVIHDDRLILRKTVNGFEMFNTPVYNNDDPHESPLNKIFFIEHGSSNKLVPVKGATAISLIMANCIQHTWCSEIISQLMDAVSNICASVPTAMLYFRPDRSVIDYILENE